jgi:hypothetical protein
LANLPKLKLKTLVNFPAQAYGRVGIDVSQEAGAFFIDLDYSGFGSFSALPPDLTPYYSLLWNNLTNAYVLCPLALIGSGGGGGAAGITRVVTAAGPVAIAANDSVVAINKTVGAPTAVSLPLASTKTGPVLISDFKRDAGTNNITITPTSPDLIQGLATLTLAANGASVQLFPLPGVGYSL